jgi:hypothetical protein
VNAALSHTAGLDGFREPRGTIHNSRIVGGCLIAVYADTLEKPIKEE